MLPAALCKRYALRYSQKVMPVAGLCAKPLIGVLSYLRMPLPGETRGLVAPCPLYRGIGHDKLSYDGLRYDRCTCH